MARPLGLQSRLAPSPDAASRELAGEAVILDLKTGVYFGLDPVGSRAWALLGQGASLKAVHAALLSEYEVEPARLEADLLELMAELRGRGLVRDA